MSGPRSMSPERKVVVIVQAVVGTFLAGVGFVLAHLQREVLAISQTDEAPVWLWFVWIGYATTIALFAFACADRPE